LDYKPELIIIELPKDWVPSVRAEDLLHVTKHTSAPFGAVDHRMQAVPKPQVARQAPCEDLSRGDEDGVKEDQSAKAGWLPQGCSERHDGTHGMPQGNDGLGTCRG
jgi:hypothetical protein